MTTRKLTMMKANKTKKTTTKLTRTSDKTTGIAVLLLLLTKHSMHMLRDDISPDTAGIVVVIVDVESMKWKQPLWLFARSGTNKGL